MSLVVYCTHGELNVQKVRKKKLFPEKLKNQVFKSLKNIVNEKLGLSLKTQFVLYIARGRA